MPLDKRLAVMKILDDQNNLGARADTKVMAFLTALYILTVFFVAFAHDIPINYFSGLLLIVYLVAAITGMWNIVMTINPRIRVRGKGENKAKLDPNRAAFFAEICKFDSAGEYKECLQEFLKDEDTLLDVYIRQIYEVSQLTAAKYKYAQRAVYFVMAALSTQFVLIFYVFLNKAIA